MKERQKNSLCLTILNLNWKTEGLKIAKSLSASKLKGIVSNSESFEDVLSNSIDRMIDDVKQDDN